MAPDAFNLHKLQRLEQRDGFRIHPLLRYGDVRDRESFPIDRMIEKADRELAAFDGSLDGIVGFWDFPVSVLVPYLAQKYSAGRHAPLEAVLKCEHKYWCRLEAKKVAPEAVPRFARVDPFDDDPLANVNLRFPFWVKPINAWKSQLGFRIRKYEDFESVLPVIRQGISRFEEPFNRVLDWIDLPPEISREDGFCLAEEVIGGRQCTLEGYMFEGEFKVYGVVDSYRTPNRSSFSRYEYPSRLPEAVHNRMIAVAEKVLRQIEYDHAPFNMEFFYDNKRDRIWLLEVNTRISQSHCDLFEKVDGASHHQVMIDIALGNRPDPPRQAGPFKYAAKFFIRAERDAMVRSVPSRRTIAQVQEAIPGTLIEIYAEEGRRLSEMFDQDAYTYELASVFVGADTGRGLRKRFDECCRLLPFEIEDQEAA